MVFVIEWQSNVRPGPGQHYGQLCPTRKCKEVNEYAALGYHIEPDLRSSLLRASDRRMILRDTSGSTVHAHQRAARNEPRVMWPLSILVPASSSLKIPRITGRERAARSAADVNWTGRGKSFHATGTLGCGVERSLLPQWEQASASLGFTWSFGHSLAS